MAGDLLKKIKNNPVKIGSKAFLPRYDAAGRLYAYRVYERLTAQVFPLPSGHSREWGM